MRVARELVAAGLVDASTAPRLRSDRAAFPARTRQSKCSITRNQVTCLPTEQNGREPAAGTPSGLRPVARAMYTTPGGSLTVQPASLGKSRYIAKGGDDANGNQAEQRLHQDLVPIGGDRVRKLGDGTRLRYLKVGSGPTAL